MSERPVDSWGLDDDPETYLAEADPAGDYSEIPFLGPYPQFVEPDFETMPIQKFPRDILLQEMAAGNEAAREEWQRRYGENDW